MPYEAEDVAAKLKAAREAKGLSQRALSNRSGVPQSHISKIEAGTVDLRISSLVAIANALDLELDLIPRAARPAVEAVIKGMSGRSRSGEPGSTSRPAYRLDGDGDANE